MKIKEFLLRITCGQLLLVSVLVNLYAVAYIAAAAVSPSAEEAARFSAWQCEQRQQ